MKINCCYSCLRLLGDVGRGGEKGQMSKKGKFALADGTNIDHLGMMMVNPHQQYNSICDTNNMHANNDSDYERDSDGCEDDDSHNNATTLASMSYLDSTMTGHNMQSSNSNNGMVPYPAKMQQMVIHCFY